MEYDGFSTVNTGAPLIRLSDETCESLQRALRVLNDLRCEADRHQAQEMLFALNRASEVLAVLTRTKELLLE
jgi:hypothetical protein